MTTQEVNYIGLSVSLYKVESIKAAISSMMFCNWLSSGIALRFFLTYSEMLSKYFTGFRGRAIFMDASDMLMLADIAELDKLFDPTKAVQVVKHNYFTKHKRKYIGTAMESKNENYPRKNWSSLILWNCEHPDNKVLDPDFVDDHTGSELHRFEWLKDDQIGELPEEWNVLVGEDDQDAKIAHYTLGIPEFVHYKNCAYSQEWHKTKSRMLNGLINMKENAYA